MPTSPVVEALKKVKVRYSGAPGLIPLSDLIEQGKLADFIRHQYPDVAREGSVQFIPQVRGFSKDNPGLTFLKKDAHQDSIKEKHGSKLAGEDHEIKIQDCFGSLNNSALLQGRALVLMHNVKKETIRHTKLKKEWSNEFDVIVFDQLYGVFICEVKQRAYQSLKVGQGKRYNLEVEQKKQEKRYELLSNIREFYGRPVPIHTVLICDALNKEVDISRTIAEETVSRNENEVNFVVEVNTTQDFSTVWGSVLGSLTRVEAPISGNIAGFLSVLYAVQAVDELKPSQLHNQFVNQFNNGSSDILWTREQKCILDYAEECFTGDVKMKLCVCGGFGSGKTLLLIKFAELFIEHHPTSRILLLIANPRYTLLQEKLRTCPALNENNNVTVGQYNEYVQYKRSTNTRTFRECCSSYSLILIDELNTRYELHTSDVQDSHLAVVTSYTNAAPGYEANFKMVKLSGSLRSTKDITEYVLHQQRKQNTVAEPILVSSLHNVSYSRVITTKIATGEQCISQCLERVINVANNDDNETIMVISVVHRYLLQRLSARLTAENVTHTFRVQSTTPGSCSDSSDNNTHAISNIVLCNYIEANGCEASNVLFVCDKDTVSHTYNAAVSVSRATTRAVVFEIESTYNDDITIHIPTQPEPVVMPCYEYVGRKTNSEFVTYLKNIADNEMRSFYKLEPALHQNKQILVTYNTRRHTATMGRISNMLSGKLEHCVVFMSINDTPLLSQDLSNFILHVEVKHHDNPGSYLYTSC